MPPGESTSSQRDRYIRIGNDNYYQEPLYVDTQSIKKLGQTRYQYTTIRDRSRRDGSEADAIVDCKNPAFITLVESRFYKKRQLIKTEPINVTQDASRLVRHGILQYQSNLVVCKVVTSIR